MAKHVQSITAYTATGNTLSVASGRISFGFDLRGPTLTVDTACSSSLVSLHSARSSLVMAQCVNAINAGANLMLSVETPAAFAKSGMLSRDGRCKTLDSNADGYVRAEAAGAMLLEHLDGDYLDLFAILNSTALNQDGRSSSLTAPNGPAQSSVIKHALKAGLLSPQNIDAIEMHGTGTGLGDPIEVGALGAVLATGFKVQNLTAGKSLVGHSEPAAGVMGIGHIQTAMSHCSSLPILHLRSLNMHAVPVIQQKNWSIQRQAAPHPSFEAEGLYLAGVSSFAFQGTNAHTILSRNDLIVPSSKPLLGFWDRSRHWVHPRIPRMIERASAQDRVLLHVNLNIPRLSMLQDATADETKILQLGTMIEIFEEAFMMIYQGKSSKQIGICNLLLQICEMQKEIPLILDISHPSGEANASIIANTRVSILSNCTTRQLVSKDISVEACSVSSNPLLQFIPQYLDLYASMKEASMGQLDAALALLSPHGVPNSVQAMQLDSRECKFAAARPDDLYLIASDSNNRIKGVTYATAVRQVKLEEEVQGDTYCVHWEAFDRSPGSHPTSLGQQIWGNMPYTSLSVLKEMVDHGLDIASYGDGYGHGILLCKPEQPNVHAEQHHGMIKSYAQENPADLISMGYGEIKSSWQMTTNPDKAQRNGVFGTSDFAATLFQARLSRCSGREQLQTKFLGRHHISGGSGAVAQNMLCWLISNKVPDVHLTSRSAHIPMSCAKLNYDGLITSTKCDVALSSDLMLFGHRDGVIHMAGGVLEDATVSNQTNANLRKVSKRIFTSCFSQRYEHAFCICRYRLPNLLPHVGSSIYHPWEEVT